VAESSQHVDDANEIKDTDIIFDCPYCGKSLAIDYRGAGLTIPCSDCGRSVEVPIPEGMEIGDLDNTEEEQEQVILNLRKSLAAAEAKILELEAEIKDRIDRRKALEVSHAQNRDQVRTIREKIGVIGRTLEQLKEAVDEVTRLTSDETP